MLYKHYVRYTYLIFLPTRVFDVSKYNIIRARRMKPLGFASCLWFVHFSILLINNIIILIINSNNNNKKKLFFIDIEIYAKMTTGGSCGGRGSQQTVAANAWHSNAVHGKAHILTVIIYALWGRNADSAARRCQRKCAPTLVILAIRTHKYTDKHIWNRQAYVYTIYVHILVCI